MKNSRTIVLAVIGAVIAAIAVRSRQTRKALPGPTTVDEVDEWGKESFPASDPPSHW